MKWLYGYFLMAAVIIAGVALQGGYMRRAARTDTNQTQVVEELRQGGCSVAITSSLGKGFPDIVVGWRGENFLFEVKDGKKIPSQRKLTEDEEDFHNQWIGQVDVIHTAEEAFEIMQKGGK